MKWDACSGPNLGSEFGCLDLLPRVETLVPVRSQKLCNLGTFRIRTGDHSRVGECAVDWEVNYINTVQYSIDRINESVFAKNVLRLSCD